MRPVADFELQLTRFELHVRRAEFPKERQTSSSFWTFRVTDQLGLIIKSTKFNFDVVVACLQQQFPLAGKEFEQQLRLKNRIQNVQKGSVGLLQMLADIAYPLWTANQYRDILCSRFIHGVQSPSMEPSIKTNCKAGIAVNQKHQHRVSSDGNQFNFCFLYLFVSFFR